VGQPRAVIFDVGKVLFDWSPRFLYERLIGDDRALEAFLAEVVTVEWHLQHDEGRLFADTSAELTARFPEHEALIALWGPRFNETIRGPMPGMPELVADLDAAGVPLYAITNFSGEFWRGFRPTQPIFDRFRDIVVSGEEGVFKPDPAIFTLALTRFGLEPGEAVFVDDNPANADAAAKIGMHALLFEGAGPLRAELVALGLLAA
jgi:2-haloacid dehalogenase